MTEPKKPASQPISVRSNGQTVRATTSDTAAPRHKGGRTPASPLRPADLLALQRAVGNQAVARMLTGPRGRPARPTSAPARETGQSGLPDQLRANVEALSGLPMGDVRVHRESAEPAALGAHAFAEGTDIHLGPGQEQHLAHEAWHVVQQKQGRVQATAQLKNGDPINDQQPLEQEADRMGALASAGAGAPSPAAAPASPRATAQPLQPVKQGKWFRLSSILDQKDEQEVAAIRELAEENLSKAFWRLVSPYKDLFTEFARIHLLGTKNETIAGAIDNILWETYYEEGKAYTSGEIMQLLEDNDVIVNELEDQPEPEDPDIEFLIEQFSKLQISYPFRSDIDQGKELHQVRWQPDADDIIVQSNPKPLKEMIAEGKWEGFPLSTTIVTRLSALRKTAKLALYNIGGNAKRKITGSRTKTKMSAFHKALAAIAGVLSNLGGATHAAHLMPKTDLSTSTNYNQDSSPTEGKHVIAKPLSIQSAKAGSPPHDGRLMTAIRNLAGPEHKSYFQMHLLNDLVFGPGQLWNLTPGPRQSNIDMESLIEHPLKNAVLGKGLVIEFEAKVNYANDPTAVDDQTIKHQPNKYRFQHIDFAAKQLAFDSHTKTWQTAAKQDPDVQAINGKRVNWRYGSLTPLVPKPSIVNPNTTVAELTVVGISPGAAKRIVAFIKANPNWKPGGKNKQQQLATAVKKWDGMARAPKISDWKATAVYWT
ncbi:MAG TPA: DUF4157 domain-containing protein [Roseiflexaceae bacterium]|nr:DUF4157 domain-containing protein [Roseiflexaceae bacterium]